MKTKKGRKQYYMMFKRNVRKRPGVLAEERTERKLARQDPKFKANELVHQLSSKQSARKRPGALAKERMEKRIGKTRS